MAFENVSGNIINVAMVLASIILFVGIAVAVIVIYFKWKKYNQFTCFIFEKDGFGKETLNIDKAGIFVDNKTNNKRFFIKKINVGLNPDNVPYINCGGKKFVFLYRVGLKNINFIDITLKNEFSINVGEEDVNWAINAYDRSKKMFSQSTLLQYLPYMALAFVSIMILVIFIYFFKEFDSLKEFAIAMKESAQILAQSRGTTTVIG